MKFISAVFCLLLSFSHNALAKDINDYFNGLTYGEKYMLLKKMPKGGELHYHLSGSVYAEDMLKMKGHYCLNYQNLSAESKAQCHDLSISMLKGNPKLYEAILRAWSMKDFHDSKESGHDHFFNTFLKFMPLALEHEPQLVANVMKIADDQNELYEEIMITPDGNSAASFGIVVQNDKTLQQKYQHLLNTPPFINHIKQNVLAVKNIDLAAKKEFGEKRLPIVRYQYYILREQDNDSVFAQALAAFESANRSPLIVGINLVQPEDGILSLRNYQKQMNIIAFLHQRYPKVHIALHAGELNAKTSDPFDLRSHIHDAIMTAHAERIGHGTAVAFENDAAKTLEYMANHDIPVEVNLSSNEAILKTTPKTHPLQLYLKYHVPVVLSTDDAGILRTSLTKEYLKAMEKYGVDYNTLKQMNRNSLSYSFLKGQSIWQVNNKSIPVSACKKALSAHEINDSCQAYLNDNPKAQLQWQLEQKLYLFEQSLEKS